MVNTLTVFTSALGKILPEGRFKEFLRRCYYKSSLQSYVLSLESLSKIMTKVELRNDNSLLVVLDDGTKLLAPKDEAADPSLTYALRYGQQKLSHLRGLEYYWGFVAVLREIFLDRIYEQYYTPKKGDAVIDVGAHIGIFTVKAARMVAGSGGRVIAIEPDVNNLRFLEQNIKINGLKNVVVVPKGIWSKPDRLKLFLGTHSMTSSLYHQEWQTDNIAEVEVDSLDNMLKQVRVARADFIKMDVEGAEIEALKGMKGALAGNANLVISAYHEQDGKATYKTVVPRLKNEGYKVHEEGGIVYGARGELIRTGQVTK